MDEETRQHILSSHTASLTLTHVINELLVSSFRVSCSNILVLMLHLVFRILLRLSKVKLYIVLNHSMYVAIFFSLYANMTNFIEFNLF